MRALPWSTAVLTALSFSACGNSTLTTRDRRASGFARALESPEPVYEFEYDAEGHLTRVALADAGTSFVNDPDGNPTQTTDALGNVTTSQWNRAGQLVSVSDPRGVETTYERDGFGTLLAVSSHDTGETRHVRDEAGNVVASTNDRGVRTTVVTDPLDRVVRVTHQRDGVPDHVSTWTYDDIADGGSGLGVLTATTFPAGETRFEHDVAGNLVATTQQVLGLTLATRATFDATTGRQSSLTYPSGRTLEFTWTLDVPTALHVTAPGGPRRALVSGVTLDSNDELEAWAWHLDDGTTVPQTMRRDHLGRVVGYHVGELRREVRYDASSLVVGYSHVDAAGAPVPLADETFSYDVVGRLTGYTRGAASHSVAHDGAGNRTSLGATRWAVEATSNRLATVTTAAGTHTFMHDATGNLETGRDFVATYDSSGRLETITRAGVTTSYRYDAEGRRVHKRNDTVDVTFVYDADDRLLGEYDATGAALREYVWLEGALIAFFQGPELLFVQRDHLGAPRALVDGLGRLRWTWLSDPFGVEPPNTSPSGLGPVDLPVRFPGQYADAESGLFYNLLRDYDPVSGRYLESDPLGLAGGLATYTYVDGSPVNWIDPTGELPIAPVVAGYLRCVASCTALESAEQALLSGFDTSCVTPEDNAKECMKECLNPLNWLKVDKLDALGKLRKKKGGLGEFGGRDALRRENEHFRELARRQGVSEADARRMHRNGIKGDQLDPGEIPGRGQRDHRPRKP